MRDGSFTRTRSLRRGKRSGFTIIEVAVSSVIVAFLAMAASMAFSSNLRAVDNAKNITSSSVFVETLMEDISAQGYDNLLALDGDRFFDMTDANDSNFVVDLVVFETTLDLIQLEAVLTDLNTNRVLGQITTLRARQ